MHILEIFVPFIPGFILVGGTLPVRTDMALRLTSVRELGYYPKIALAIIAAYILGWVLFLIVYFGLNYAEFLIWRKVRYRKGRFSQSWKDAEWQKVAREFIGANLAPPLGSNDWSSWYQVLQLYFLNRLGSDIFIAHLLLTGLQTTGLAGVIVLAFSRVSSWFLWIACVLAIGIGGSWPSWTVPIPEERQFTAVILRELKRSSRNPPPS